MKKFNSIQWNPVPKGFAGVSSGGIAIVTAIISIIIFLVNSTFSEDIKVMGQDVNLTTSKLSPLNFEELLFSSTISDLLPNKAYKPFLTSQQGPKSKNAELVKGNSYSEKATQTKSKSKNIFGESSPNDSKYQFTKEDYDYFEKYGLERIVSEAYYEGGQKALEQFITENLKYPRKARKNKIEGRVIVLFDVNVLGEIENVRIKESFNPELNKEAVRVVAIFTNWKPKQINFIRVKSTLQLPITFELE